MIRIVATITAAGVLCLGASGIAAQCADLIPPPPVPERDTACKDNIFSGTALKKSCAEKHAEQVGAWEDRYRNFGGTIRGTFSLLEQRTANRSHGARGCKGETVAIELDGGTLNDFAYQLRSPSGKVVSEGSLRPTAGRAVTGPYVTLPETGTYEIMTSLQSGSYTRNPEGKSTYEYRYSIRFAGGGQEPISLGTSTTGTIDAQGIYARRIEVPAGRSVRLSVSVQGESPSRLVISEADGTPMVEESLTGRRVVETLQAATEERTYLIRVTGSAGTGGRGVEIRTEEVEDIQRRITLGEMVSDSFAGLPPTFDALTERDKERMEEFLRTYSFSTNRTGQMFVTVTVAEAANLKVQLRMFGETSQRMIVRDTIIGTITTIPVYLEQQEPFIIEVRPIYARMGPRSRPLVSVKFTADDPRRSAPVRSRPPQ